jgi:hypothetical protein
VIRWQLAPGLRAERQSATELLVRDGAGNAIASIWTPLATELAIVAREVSLRLGHHVPAQCIEVTLPPSLEVVTVIVPHSGSALAQPATAAHSDLPGFAWADRSGCHRIALGRDAIGVGPVEAAVTLAWSVESGVGSRARRHVAAAATPAPQLVAEQPVTAWLASSGRIRVFELAAGAWMELPAARIGCGGN